MKVTIPGISPLDIARDGRQPRRTTLGDRWRRQPRLLRWGAPLVVLLGLVVVVALMAQQGSAPETPAVATPTSSSSPRLVAHGVVAPVSQARVGTLGGGVLLGLSVNIGDAVEAHRELARVRGSADVEVLTAPFGGTVTGLLAHTGDTLVPGAGVVMVADLSRLQVETTDVDEFLIGHVHANQSVQLQIEALDRREVTGRVRTVALQPQTKAGGDQHYPVTIDLGGAQPELRPGMSVRLTFPD